MTADEAWWKIAAALRLATLRFSSEAQYQVQILAALRTAGLQVEREVRLGEHGRVDFALQVEGGLLAIEIKIGGGLTAVERQIGRYAAHDRVVGVLVISSRMQLSKLPDAIAGKPVRVIANVGAAFA